MWLLAHPGLPLWLYLVCAALAGFDGGNFDDHGSDPAGARHLGDFAAVYRHVRLIRRLRVRVRPVLQINFAAGGQNAAQASLHAAQIAFIGPLLGSLSRVYGGKLADRIGGGRVTLWVFAGMILGAGILVGVSTLDDHTAGPATALMMGGLTMAAMAGGGGVSGVHRSCSRTNLPR